MKGFVAEPDDAVDMERGGNGHAGEHRPPPARASASWPLRIGALVVLVIAGAIAVVLARRGMSLLAPSQLAPTETVTTLKEDKEWLKQRLTSGATSS